MSLITVTTSNRHVHRVHRRWLSDLIHTRATPLHCFHPILTSFLWAPLRHSVRLFDRRPDHEVLFSGDVPKGVVSINRKFSAYPASEKTRSSHWRSDRIVLEWEGVGGANRAIDNMVALAARRSRSVSAFCWDSGKAEDIIISRTRRSVVELWTRRGLTMFAPLNYPSRVCKRNLQKGVEVMQDLVGQLILSASVVVYSIRQIR